MEDKFDAFSELTELISQLEEQKKLIYVQLDQLVSQIISERITDQHEIEHVMDSLIDFGDDERFLALYKKLCRYVYTSIFLYKVSLLVVLSAFVGAPTSGRLFFVFTSYFIFSISSFNHSNSLWV